MQYTTNIHLMYQQLLPILHQRYQLNADNKHILHQMIHGNGGHIGYILIKPSDGSEFVMEVKYHPQYLEQLLQ